MSQKQSPDLRELLARGIDAARANQRDRARELLMQVVDQDEHNVTAWLWLSGVVDDLEDREICLENVLALDPENDVARRGLAWIRAERAKQKPPEIPDQGLIPKTSPLYAEPQPTEENPFQKANTAFTSPETTSPATPWESPDPYSCPYCAAPTREEDTRCPTCNNPLWLTFRRREEPSWWLINVMLYQIGTTLLFAAIPLVMLAYVAYKVLGRFEPLLLLPTYLGLPGNLPLETAHAALEILPRLYVWPFFVLALYSLGMLIGAWLRCQVVFYLLFWGAAVKIALSITAIALMRTTGLIWGGAGLLFSLVTILIIFQLEDDFLKRHERLYFALSRQIKGPINQIRYGEMLAQRKMWALAILYLQAGLAQMPGQIAGRATLIWAYIQLGRYEMARCALREAQRLAPNASRLSELARLLNESPTVGKTTST